jgi:Protein of unknown function (DUF3617)
VYAVTIETVRMFRLGVALVCALPVSAEADHLTIEPGQWKITSNTVKNGATKPPTVETRCITPKQSGDISRTFGSVTGILNSSCAPTQYETTGRKFTWHLQCKGGLNLDILGIFDFDTRSHYTATVTTKGWLAGELTDMKTEIEGARVGACPR